MNVRDLIAALRDVPGDCAVRIVPDGNDDEWCATVVTRLRDTVFICVNNRAIPSNEIVLHDDAEEIGAGP